jgi:hypothetical protein
LPCDPRRDVSGPAPQTGKPAFWRPNPCRDDEHGLGDGVENGTHHVANTYIPVPMHGSALTGCRCSRSVNGGCTLFSPDEVPDLHDLHGTAFKTAYDGYEMLGLCRKLLG